MMPPTVVVLSDPDPVASRLADQWGTLPSVGTFVDGAAVRKLGPETLLLRRPHPHIHDEHLDARLPPELGATGLTLVFPSIHRSEQNLPCLTVHPLGNPGPAAEMGGRPRTLVPTDPGRMVGALRSLAEAARPAGLEVTYEATHHGPELSTPAFFIEIGYGTATEPPREAVSVLSAVIPSLAVEPGDRVALGAGGGHYAPHFTDLALRRRWSFGHILSRHALDRLDVSTARAALDATPGVEGLLFARASDAEHPALSGLAPRLRDGEADRRGDGRGTTSRDDRSTSGT